MVAPTRVNYHTIKSPISGITNRLSIAGDFFGTAIQSARNYRLCEKCIFAKDFAENAIDKHPTSPRGKQTSVIKNMAPQANFLDYVMQIP